MADMKITVTVPLYAHIFGEQYHLGDLELDLGQAAGPQIQEAAAAISHALEPSDVTENTEAGFAAHLGDGSEDYLR